MSAGMTWINGADLFTAFGFVTRAYPNLHATGEATWDAVPSMGRYGVTLVRPAPRDNARAFAVEGTLIADTTALLDGALAALRGHVARRELEVRTKYAPDKIIRARVASPLQVEPINRKELRGRSMRCRVELLAHDPLWYARYSEPVALNAARTMLPPCEAFTSGLLRVWGPWTSLGVIVRDMHGAARRQLAFTGSLGATDTLVVDHMAGTVRLRLAGAAASYGRDRLVNTHDFPLAIDPLWGDPAAGVGPTMELTGLTGGGGEWLTTRTWL